MANKYNPFRQLKFGQREEASDIRVTSSELDPYAPIPTAAPQMPPTGNGNMNASSNQWNNNTVLQSDYPNMGGNQDPFDYGQTVVMSGNRNMGGNQDPFDYGQTVVMSDNRNMGGNQDPYDFRTVVMPNNRSNNANSADTPGFRTVVSDRNTAQSPAFPRNNYGVSDNVPDNRPVSGRPVSDRPVSEPVLNPNAGNSQPAGRPSQPSDWDNIPQSTRPGVTPQPVQRQNPRPAGQGEQRGESRPGQQGTGRGYAPGRRDGYPASNPGQTTRRSNTPETGRGGAMWAPTPKRPAPKQAPTRTALIGIVLDGTLSFTTVYPKVYYMLEALLNGIQQNTPNNVTVKYGVTMIYDQPQTLMFHGNAFTSSTDEILHCLKTLEFSGGSADGKENINEAVNMQLMQLCNAEGAADSEYVVRGMFLFTDSLPADGQMYPDFTSAEPGEYGEYTNFGLRFADIYAYNDDYMPRFRIVDRFGRITDGSKNECSCHDMNALMNHSIKDLSQIMGDKVSLVLRQMSVR